MADNEFDQLPKTVDLLNIAVVFTHKCIDILVQKYALCLSSYHFIYSILFYNLAPAFE